MAVPIHDFQLPCDVLWNIFMLNAHMNAPRVPNLRDPSTSGVQHIVLSALTVLRYSSQQGGSRKKKKLPRVEFFLSAILAGLTLLCNQAHVYIRKYDIIKLGSSSPRCLPGRKNSIFVGLYLQHQC